MKWTNEWEAAGDVSSTFWGCDRPSNVTSLLFLYIPKFHLTIIVGNYTQSIIPSDFQEENTIISQCTSCCLQSKGKIANSY